MKKGRAGTMTCDDMRNGTTTLFAGLITPVATSTTNRSGFTAPETTASPRPELASMTASPRRPVTQPPTAGRADIHVLDEAQHVPAVPDA